MTGMSYTSVNHVAMNVEGTRLFRAIPLACPEHWFHFTSIVGNSQLSVQ